MATKRSTLPPITQLDLTRTPERLRTTPNGGYAWRCHYCGQFASSETRKGRYVCRRHGGSTPRQRDPRPTPGDKPARPPGRPITTGKHSKSPRLTVHELVQEHQEQLGEAEATDQHMLYLRGHLELWSAQREDEDTIEKLLTYLQEYSRNLTNYLSAQKSLYDIASTERAIYHLASYTQEFNTIRDRYQTFLKLTKGIEKRYERLVRLTKIRTQTREKNAELHQLTLVNTLVPQLLTLLGPRLDAPTRHRLQTRLRQEFSTMPLRALTPNTLADPLQHLQEPDPAGAILKFVTARYATMGGTPDEPHKDMLYLKAYLETMNSLYDTTRATKDALDDLTRELERFLCAPGLDRHHTPVTVREVLDSYKSLKPTERLLRHIKNLSALLDTYGADLEDRHSRIVHLALVRAQTQLAEAKTTNLALERHLLRRLHQVLREVLTPDQVEYAYQTLLTPPLQERPLPS